MEKPDIVILRESKNEGNFLIKLYGINFEVKEGSTIEYKPLQEIADSLGITLEKLQSELRSKSLLDGKNYISEEECWIEGIDGKDIQKGYYASFALVHIFNFPENCPDELTKVKEEDLTDKGICGHVEFISELLNPLTARVKKLSPKDGDIIVINGQISKRDKHLLAERLIDSKCKALIMVTDSANVSLADENKMKNMGWVREVETITFKEA